MIDQNMYSKDKTMWKNIPKREKKTKPNTHNKLLSHTI